MEKSNKKRLIAIIGLVLVVVVLVFVIIVNMNAEKRAERKLNNLAKTFYNYYYEEKSEKNNMTEFLSEYADTGLTVKLKDLKIYLDNHKIENYKSLSLCDENKTKVTFYPVSPYSKKDKVIKVNLECNFK